MGYGYTHYNDEAFLSAAATAALDGEPVVAAGIFSWAGLSAAYAVGGMVGATGASVATDSAVGAGLGAAVGGRLAAEETASARGETVPLVVAVTADAVHLLDWDGEAAGPEIRRFDRARLDTEVRHLGASFFVTLTDRESGEHYSIHGAKGPLARGRRPDHAVMVELGLA